VPGGTTFSAASEPQENRSGLPERVDPPKSALLRDISKSDGLAK